MSTSRREFLTTTLTAAAAFSLRDSMAWQAQRKVSPRVGACMFGLETAKEAGLDGVEVPLKLDGDKIALSDPKARETLKEQMRKTGLPVRSLMMGFLNSFPLASDPRGPSWLEQAIDIAKDVEAKVILVAFFGKGDLLGPDKTPKQADVDEVVKRIQVAAPRARDAGVVLAIENYLDCRQNAQVLERVANPAVQVYYDVYNTGVTRGYDVPAEIRALGSRIAQFHFKNGPQFLGEGKLQYEPIAAAIREIGYQGWIILETSSPTKAPAADARRNAEFVRRLFA